ncbi:MAG: VanZ family protein [Bryobacteraceae bacterium]
MRRIFYLTCALVAYGSLYPFHFVLRDSPAGALQAFSASLDFVVDRGFLRDVLVNLLVYIPVGFFFVLDERPERPAWLRTLRAALAGAALSLCLEFLQYYFPPRDPSLIDLLNNTLSAAAGGLLGIVFAARARHAFDALAGLGLARPSAALFLLLVWAAALFSPGDWGGFQTLAKLRAFLGAPALAPGLFLVALVQWIGLGALAAAIAGRARAPAMLLAGGLALPLRFLIPGQHPQPYEFAAAATAIVCWHAAPIRRRLSPRLIAFLLVSGLVVDELRPWHFVHRAGRFEWIPFAALLDLTWTTALPILFRKAAIYGTVVWSIARAGLGIPPGALLVATLLGALEAIQIFLPGRTAETTDSLLALIVGLILLRLDHKYGPDPGAGSGLPPGPAALDPPSEARSALPAAPPQPRGVAPSSGRGIWTGGRRSGL